MQSTLLGQQLTMLDEFRSPLHGILASAEFLRDSSLDASQIEFISTIQNCSGTLLVRLFFKCGCCVLMKTSGYHQSCIGLQ
jgi:hypothetical protein